MVKVTVAADCGNSPKMQLLRDLLIAYAEGEAAPVLDHLADDVAWEIVGGQTLRGKEAVAAHLAAEANQSWTELVIDHILSHGRLGAANGTLTRRQGQTTAFCNIDTFRSTSKHAPISEVRSYLIG